MKIIRVIDRNNVVITALNDFDPLNNLNQLSLELQKIKFKGRVLFDLLSINGNTSNRFVKIDFDGQTFVRSSFNVIKSARNINMQQDEFFRANPNELINSVLSSSEIKQFINSHS